MGPELILFAIEAGVKLGQKFYEVMVDANRERAIYLPLGDLFGSIQFNKAIDFFRNDENGKKLFRLGGIFANLQTDQEIIDAYHYVLAVMQQCGTASLTDDVYKIIVFRHDINENIKDQLPQKDQTIDLKQLPFDQLKKGQGHAPPVLRLIGVLVDVGIDYFQTNPEALGKDSAARKIVTAFVNGIEKIDFEKEAQGAENQDRFIGKLQEIAGGVMLAGLQAFGDSTNLLTKDQRIQVLLGGMTGAIVADFRNLEEDLTEGAKDRRIEFYQDITSSLLRGAMAGVADNPKLFFKGNGDAQRILQDTVTHVFKGLEGQEDLFTPDSLEVILKSSLVAVSEDASIVTEQPILQQLITGSVKAITDAPDIFSEATAAAILKNGLDALGQNIKTLINPDNPERLFLVETLQALTAGLGTTLGSGKLQDLLSTQQLISLSQIIFNEVAQHPEQLLGKGSTGPDPKITALAQIVGSVGKALGDDPKKLISGDGLLTLIQTAIRTAAQNVNNLLDLDNQASETNFIYKVLQALTEGFSQSQGIQDFKTGGMFVNTACRVIVTVSNNLGFATGGKDGIPGLIVELMTRTGGQDVWSRLNSGNFPLVFNGLLRQVMLGKLKLDDAGAIQPAVIKILEFS